MAWHGIAFHASFLVASPWQSINVGESELSPQAWRRVRVRALNYIFTVVTLVRPSTLYLASVMHPPRDH